MHRFRFTYIYFLILISFSSLADTEFEAPIPVETVEALFNSYYTDNFAVYSDIAEEFPDFAVPTGFFVVGSVYQMSTLKVVFETDLDEAAALQSMIEVFEAQNWMQFPTQTPQIPEVGFIAPAQFNMGRSESLCRDDHGYLTLRYLSGERTNNVAASISVDGPRSQVTCEQQISMRLASHGRASQPSGIRQYLPRMEIPRSKIRTRPRVFISAGTTFTGNSVEIGGALTTDQQIGELYQLLSDQIESQGWEYDSEDVGSLSASGTWTRAPESNLSLIGTLSIIDSGDNEFKLRFDLSAAGYSRDGSALFNPLHN